MIGGGLARLGVQIKMAMLEQSPRFRRPASSASFVATAIAVFARFVS